MSNEDQHLEGNEESTPIVESESEESTVEGLTQEEMMQKITNLEKGIQKLATEKGREKASNSTETVQPETEVTESSFSANEIVYLDNHPEAKAIWEDVKVRAEELGKDPIIYYNSDPIMQDYAKRNYTEAQQESENKNKIESPSSIIGSTGKTDFSKVTDESYSDLSDADKVKFNEYMIEKEKAGN